MYPWMESPGGMLKLPQAWSNTNMFSSIFLSLCKCI
jgi:hypothetical protein